MIVATENNDLITEPTRVVVGWTDVWPLMCDTVTALSIKREGNKFRVLADEGPVLWVDYYKPVKGE